MNSWQSAAREVPLTLLTYLRSGNRPIVSFICAPSGKIDNSELTTSALAPLWHAIWIGRRLNDVSFDRTPSGYAVAIYSITYLGALIAHAWWIGKTLDSWIPSKKPIRFVHTFASRGRSSQCIFAVVQSSLWIDLTSSLFPLILEKRMFPAFSESLTFIVRLLVSFLCPKGFIICL